MSQKLGDPATLVDRLAGSAKYRCVARETVELIVEAESARARDAKDLERRARQVLHRATAHYLTRRPPAALEAELTAGALHDKSPEEIRTWCRRALATHASSAERLEDLDDFYPALFDLVGRSDGPILDLACALNVLTLPWLREVTAAGYLGIDFNERFVNVGRALVAALGDRAAIVQHCDALTSSRALRGTTALLLKTYHCIENRAPGSALELVDGLQVCVVVVSFPLRSFGGRTGGFQQRYGHQLRSLVDARG